MNGVGSADNPDVPGQRLHLTLLFSDLCDYTALSEASDPEDIDALKHAVENRAKAVIGRYRGTVNQFYGDGILAVFGYPAPDEDDVRRAIEAALELHAAVRSLPIDRALPPDFVPQLHSGVHSGVIFVREGDPLHGRYELTGDAVNTTQRLCAAAGRDEILVSKATLSGLEAYFMTEEVQPLALKGKDRPFDAYRVLGRSDVDTRFEARYRRGLTPFIGRRAELEQLSTLLTEIGGCQSRIARIVGPAGIGKTRLFETFKRTLPSGFAVYAGECEHFGDVGPYRPFARMLRQICPPESAPPSAEESAVWIERWLTELGDSLGEYGPPLLQLLSLIPWPDDEPPSSGSAEPLVGRALAAVVSAMAAKHPVTLILDDWQWADDASNQALATIIRTVRDRPVLILVGTRPRDDTLVALEDALTLELRPFSYEESARAVRALLPRALDLGVSAAIHARAGGSPLFVEELCRSLPPDAGDVIDAEVPTTLHGLIQARVSSLRPEAIEVIRAASVIGNEFHLWLLDVCCGQMDTRALLVDLVEQDLIYGDDAPAGAFHFKHGITRDVVYESVPIQTRRRLHAMVASAIERRHTGASASDHWEALAYHYAGSSEHQRAIDYAELAGDKASATSALDRARFHFGAALSALDRQRPQALDRKRWLRISPKWAAACVYSPARTQIRILDKSADYARALGATDAMGHAEYWLGWIHYALGEQGEAIHHYEKALQIARGIGHSKLIAQLLANLGQSEAAAGEYDLALAHLDEAIAMKRDRATRAPRRGIPVGLAYALGCRALVHGDRGDFQRAYDDMGEAVHMVQGSAHAIEGSLLGLLAMIQLWQGEWGACLESTARARSKAEQVNGPYVLAITSAMAGYARWMLDRAPEALREMRQSVEWLEGREIALFLSFSLGHLAEALATLPDDPRAAEPFAQRALRRAEERDPIGETSAYRALARIELQSPFAHTRKHLESALRSAERRGSRRDLAVTRLLVARVQVASGATLGVGSMLREMHKAFCDMAMPWYASQAKELLGKLVDPPGNP